MEKLIGFNDNFNKITKNGVYEPRGVAFLMKNTGNTEIVLNDSWVLLPCETYGLLNILPFAVTNGTYRVKFGDVNVIDAKEPIKNQLSIAEVHYSTLENTKFAQ